MVINYFVIDMLVEIKLIEDNCKVCGVNVVVVDVWVKGGVGMFDLVKEVVVLVE